MKKLLFLAAFLPALSFGAFRTNFLTVSSSATFISSMTLSGGILVDSTPPSSGEVLKYDGTNWAPAVESGGGGASTLEVFSNFDGTRSSPTASISIGDALSLSVTGSTAVITVDFSSVTSRSDVILLQDILQSGATFYVSSGTIENSSNVQLRLINNDAAGPNKGALIDFLTDTGSGDALQNQFGYWNTNLTGFVLFGDNSNLQWGMAETFFPTELAMRIYNVDGSQYVALRTSNTASTDLTFVLPLSDGSSGDALITDGAGNLSFSTIGGGGGGGLEVFSNFDGVSSSPTTAISIGDALSLSVTGSTAVVTVDFSSAASKSDIISVYPATATPSFPFGVSATTGVFTSTVTVDFGSVLNVLQPSGSGLFGQYDLFIASKPAGPDYGGIRLGNSGIYRSNQTLSAALDLGGTMVFRNEANLDAGNDPGIEFLLIEQGNTGRFAIPESGAGNATAMIRSVTMAGPWVADNDVVTCSYWGFAAIDCDTSGTGADLGVQDDIELLGVVYLSTAAVPATVPAGRMALTANTAGQLVARDENEVDLTFGILEATQTWSGVNTFTASATVSGQLSVSTIKFPDGTIQVTSAPVSGGGVSVYPATATASFPFGFSASTGVFSSDVSIQSESSLLLYDADSSNYVGWKSSATVGSNQVYGLPASVGTADQILAINAVNGDGTTSLYWKDDGGSGGGVSVYPATATASFPFGMSASTLAFTSGSDFITFKASATVDHSATYVLPKTTGTTGQVLAAIDVNGDGEQALEWIDLPAKVFSWSGPATLPLQISENIATVTKATGTTSDQLQVSYDDSTEECRGVVFQVPPAISTAGTVTFSIYWVAESTFGAVVWEITHNQGISDGGDIDSVNVTETASADTVTGTSENLNITTWTETVSNLNWATDEQVNAEFCRDPASAQDDMVGDARATMFSIEIPRGASP
jgi:hypothetical protein